MKRLLLGTSVLAFAVVACENTATGPAVLNNTDGPLYGFVAPENPPPPPIDSGAVGTAETSEGSPLMTVNFSVTYMLNKPENSGWLKFNPNGDTSLDVSQSAAIRLTNGVFSGKGFIRVVQGGSALSIDLSKVSFDGTSFDSCPSAGSIEKGTCFTLRMSGDGATFSSERTGKISATFIIGPDKPATCGLTDGDFCTIDSGQ